MNTPHRSSITRRSRASRLSRVLTAVTIGTVVGLALAACATGSSAEPTGSTPSTSVAPSASAPPTAAPTPSPTPTPSLSPDSDDFHSPMEDDPANPANATTGCPANDATIPAGAEVSEIEDVDGDGKPDTQFFSENPAFVYGISTASGATYSIPSGMAGPGKHSGLTALLEGGVALTLLDDSRSARVLAFVSCAFVTPLDESGNPVDPALYGLGDSYTGFQCSSGHDGRSFYGMHAVRQDDGLYTITRTPLYISIDGALLTSGTEEPVATGLALDDPQTNLAMRATCDDVPKVATSGR